MESSVCGRCVEEHRGPEQLGPQAIMYYLRGLGFAFCKLPFRIPAMSPPYPAWLPR